MDISSIFLGRKFNETAIEVNKKHSANADFNVPFALTSDLAPMVEYHRYLEGLSDEDWENEKAKTKEKPKSLGIQRFIKQENKMNWRDEEVSLKLGKMFDDIEGGRALTIEDEFAILDTYVVGETYLDRNCNKLEIVSVEARYVEVKINPHLGKMKNSTTKLDRVSFLERMNFQPGITMQDDIN